MQAVASAPSATPGTPTVEQSATANGETTPPRTPQFQTALQLAQLAAPAAAAASTLLQTNSTSAEKAAPKAAPSKHAPNAATTATATTDAAGTDTQPANRKLTIEAPLATAAQQPGTQGTVSDGAPTAGGKTDAAVAQLPASATQLVINLHTPGDAQSATAQAAPSSAPIPLDALAVHIARKFESGESRFEIRLDPIELGKLDISVTVGDDGRVQAVVRAERPETLDMLQRDARLLEGQLRQSGLNVDSNSLNFSLGSGNDHRQTLANGAHGFAQALDIVPEIEPIKTATAIVSLRDGVDIRI